jgi:hypothetical protein
MTPGTLASASAVTRPGRGCDAAGPGPLGARTDEAADADDAVWFQRDRQVSTSPPQACT